MTIECSQSVHSIDIRPVYYGVQMVICGGKSRFHSVSTWFLGFLNIQGAMKSHFRNLGNQMSEVEITYVIMRVYSRNALSKPYTHALITITTASTGCEAYPANASNAVNDCICQRTIITTKLIMPFLEFILGNRKSLKISCVLR